MQNLWDACLRRLEQELPAQQFNTWIRPLSPEASSDAPNADEVLVLSAPNRFVLELVRERFAARIAKLAAEATGKECDLRLVLARGAEPLLKGAPIAPARGAEVSVTVPGERGRLNRTFTFDSFVTGKANQLARAAAIQVAENPGISYNPLFIYGGVGLGKTHLLQAIGNALAEQRPQARIRYSHAEQYVTDVVRAYQQKSFDEFKRYYHSLDLLLIDDIQFFSNKGRTQEEFFYAFNALVEAHKQIVITCDTYPKEIAGMEERLISRFGWGLTVAIEPPELEMRVAIVLKKAEAEAVELSEEIAFFIAKHIRSNVRELEGALKKVLAFARFNGRELSLELAKEALRDILNVASRQVSVDGIQKTVAEYFKIKVSDMHSKRRNRNVARPRQVAMALAKDLTQMSLPEIGEAFGNRDHTTVLHACRTIASLRKQDTALNRDYLILEQVLKG
ncbi:MAG: chromosomal replication initiator protein DnaA [Betaproteobacteria bacterium]|nr:chromosomal replication initiator protein DnaA [Betaproteobacteria bacterium]